MAKKLSFENEEILWEDRKRRLGLPLSFTRYQVSKERLIVRRGFFKTVTDETLIYRIMDIRLVRTLVQKILGVGTIVLISTDKTDPTQELRNIKNSDWVRQYLSKLVEQQRVERGITSSEFLGGGRPGHGHAPGK